MLRWGSLLLYCAALFLTLDWAYSRFFHQKDVLGRAPHESYHHGLVANFQGFDSWGLSRAPLNTNSLGFKDSRVRDVTATPLAQRRTILIGDSFTEGVGMAFEDTFAGMLLHAGQEREIEFLNAGVLSYSPVIYYRKIKYLLEAGLKFDEVVVFSDISDVNDEATSYFCIDDNPAYRRHCPHPPRTSAALPSLDPAAMGRASTPRKQRLHDHFSLTGHIVRRLALETKILTGDSKRHVTRKYRRAAWTDPGFDVGNAFAPLGVEGGVERSLANMQLLADLLRDRGIPLSIVVYPWAYQLAQDDRQSRQVAIWRDFCATNCKQFIDLFPEFFAEKDAHSDWFERLFIPGDVHYSVVGHRIIFQAASRLLL
jgi:hypothetical protein